MTTSKRIKKADDACKALIIEALGSHVTYGFDIDSIYYFESEDKWVVIEFLKCDHQTVRPKDSHPSRYWIKNWRKFASIWKLTSRLEEDLYLVNYEDLQHAHDQGRGEREFFVIKVSGMVPTDGGGITKERSKVMTFEQFKAWFQRLNARGINL